MSRYSNETQEETMKRHDVEALKKRIGDRVVVASVSGGKDSTAMALYLKELGIPYRAVFMDTGWEHADVYRYVRDVLPKHIGPIETISAEVEIPSYAAQEVERFEKALGRPSPMVRLIFKKAMFPSRIRRYCTQDLKMKPLKRYLDALDCEPVSTSGVRAAESAARSKMPEWENWDMADCEQWRPLINWSDQDVVDIHKRHNVPPNPLYLRGAHRVGCWPCIYARKSEIRNMADTDPERVEIVENLETVVSELARQRLIKKGKTPRYEMSSWFMSRVDWVTPWPVSKVVEWSRTKFGGVQFEMFAAPEREFGCMRWGVCDTGIEGEE